MTVYSQTLVMAQNVSTPDDLDLVSAFVNTWHGLDDDELETPADLAAWLAGHGLPAGKPRPADLQRARKLREGLRSLLYAHNGGAPDPEAIAACNAVARRAPLRVVVAEDGHVGLQPGGEGVDAALARILAIVERAQAAGTWERLKACAAPDCRWAYYDRTRNHSRTWCDMAVCGNRAKARAYRSRKS